MTTRTTCQLAAIGKRNNRSDGWLPYWRLKNTDHRDAAIIPIFLASDLDHLDMSYSATHIEQAMSASSYMGFHGLNGMVYGFRNLKAPDFIKVGRSKDAWQRLHQSPWSKQLGFTQHADRKVEFVAICQNIHSKEVETALHSALSHLSVDIDWGKEWFEADGAALAEIIETIADRNQEEIWIDRLSRALSTYTDPQQVVDTVLDADTSSLPASFAKLGFPSSIRRRGASVEIETLLWCPVRYGNSYPDAHFDFFAGEYPTYDAGLSAEMRAFAVSGEAMIPDVYTVDGEVVSRDPFQYVESAELIYPFAEDWEIDERNDEWEVDGAVYKVLFSKLALISESFLISAGKVKRLGSRLVA
ncbi:GIY-YIG nuclease family protein [Frigidibacter mobilis]|uniref:Bacteriophage T5 Orf172 DNA-binding domain-containing protein n=1 Tax=Frigidibacter mobilis TaxID=1335048 RepID=A0A159Z0A3_9RHOB|nr:GIY-YIG nuclease family protein [Frigidibacter mobilis]AMY68316.1 hypothetical protein AKL17_1057 [Frigidibacter mobilis]